MKVYRVEADEAAGYSGELLAAPKWMLPGLEDCPGCGATWANTGVGYPCVDLSEMPWHEEYKEPRAEHFDELLRLREQVRPLLPPGALLPPGTTFGPLKGRARGTFGQFHMQNPWTLCLRREALERLQEAGIRGLQGCRVEVRFREKNPPELLEPQLELHGRFHPDCMPADRQPPCPKCERDGFSLPDPYILDATTLPTTVDVFRLADWTTAIFANERFVEAARRLSLDGVVFREVPVR